MVRRALVRATFLVAAVAGLGSCQFLGLALSSTFPASVTQITARHDVSSLVSAPDAYSFSIGDVATPGHEYVVLASTLSTSGIRLIFMDTDLNVLLTLTAQDIAALGGSITYATAKRDAFDRILVGDILFPTNAAGLVLPPTVQSWIPQSAGFDSAVGGNFNLLGFDASGNGFSYNKFPDTWSPASSFGAFPILASPGANTSFSVHGVFSDPDPARQYTLFVLSDADTGLDHYFVIPMTDLNSGVLASPLQSFYEVFTKPTTDPNLLGYANGGFIRFVPSGGNARSGAFVRTDLSGNDQANQLPSYNLSEIQIAYSQPSAFYFVYDMGTRSVTRMAAWWN
jgi:hypothetical protein